MGVLGVSICINPKLMKTFSPHNKMSPPPLPSAADLMDTTKYVEVDHKIALAAGIPMKLAPHHKVFVNTNSTMKSPAILTDSIEMKGICITCACGATSGVWYVFGGCDCQQHCP